MNDNEGPAPDLLEGGSFAVRLRLDLSYDGTDFRGWATQPGLRTVAGELTNALTILLRQIVPLVVAGRTDAGVHATGQVAHVDVPAAGLLELAPRPGPATWPGHLGSAAATLAPDPSPVGSAADLSAGCLGLLRRLAGLLPKDVRVRSVGIAPVGFDARFSGLRRHYRYRITTAEWGADPLRRNDIYVHRRPLDGSAMARAAAALIGLHDFAAYCKPREGATTVRELQQLDVVEKGDQIVVEVAADAFCHSMVRSLVGALIAVGEHRAPIEAPAAWLAAAQRTSAVHVAPACGLTMIGVDYPADCDLAARAAVTRSVRVALA